VLFRSIMDGMELIASTLVATPPEAADLDGLRIA
jgi:hypothetical protein